MGLVDLRMIYFASSNGIVVMGLVGFSCTARCRVFYSYMGANSGLASRSMADGEKSSTAIQYERGYGGRPGQLGIIDEIS